MNVTQNQQKAVSPPSSIRELQARLKKLEGYTIAKLYHELNIPTSAWLKKGIFGQAIELFLGADAFNEACPDFKALGIELKSLPLDAGGVPKESTFVTSINFKAIKQETWQTSTVYKKLSHVLWLPFEASPNIPFSLRRVARGFFWQPTQQDEAIIAKDWQELTELVVLGKLNEISAKLGEVLQIRPKAANGKSLCAGVDDRGQVIQTLPRGFYLRRSFTARLLKDEMG